MAAPRSSSSSSYGSIHYLETNRATDIVQHNTPAAERDLERAPLLRRTPSSHDDDDDDVASGPTRKQRSTMRRSMSMISILLVLLVVAIMGAIMLIDNNPNQYYSGTEKSLLENNQATNDRRTIDSTMETIKQTLRATGAKIQTETSKLATDYEGAIHTVKTRLSETKTQAEESTWGTKVSESAEKIEETIKKAFAEKRDDEEEVGTNDRSSSSSSLSSAASRYIELQDPVDDMDLLSVTRKDDALPSEIWDHHRPVKNTKPLPAVLPTNSWYLNLVSNRAATKPDDSTRVYTIPYLIDTAASSQVDPSVQTLEGIRVHWPVIQASDTNIQMVDNYKNGLCLGGVRHSSTAASSTATNSTNSSTTSSTSTSRYKVIASDTLSPLGVGLVWGDDDDDNSSSSSSSSDTMTTHIIRGMPYATMEYAKKKHRRITPTLYSYNGLASAILIDSTIAAFSSNNTTKQPSKNKNENNDDTSTAASNSTSTTGTFQVQQHLHLHFRNSDFTWMVFVNKPVHVSWTIPNNASEPTLQDFQLSFQEEEEEELTDERTTTTTNQNKNLVIRVAMLNQCTTGVGTMQTHCLERKAWSETQTQGYEQVLIESAPYVPTNPTIQFQYTNEADTTDTDTTAAEQTPTATIDIDWNVVDTTTTTRTGSIEKSGLLMFALPHHQTSLGASSSGSSHDAGNSTSTSTETATVTNYCMHTFHGGTCLVQNSEHHWLLTEQVGTPLAFVAPRPPEPELIPELAQALQQDIAYTVSNNTLRGAADTYFSGKTIARLARIIVIAHELRALADQHQKQHPSASSASFHDTMSYYGDVTITPDDIAQSCLAASQVELPTKLEVDTALHQLKVGVTAWFRSTAEAPYVYDTTWGGLVNCGCHYVGKGDTGYCNNTFPDCPALIDVNEDFGNGYYNDHHYHYGYHVYAAAVAAKFDPQWGRDHFEDVMLYIRDFANPFEDDKYFPQYRSKDWFLGSSWASGIISAENSPHGRNEESSSEAISAYEGVTLYGSAMVDAFSAAMAGPSSSSSEDDDDKDNWKKSLETAKLIRDSGQLLTSTEIAATNRYWHVWSSDTHNNTYPKEYIQPVVGMLYDTMATFQTWFSSWAVVSMGIQLIPLTPVAETRDDIDWATMMYPKYDKACKDAGDFCIDNGWSILQAGLLATSMPTNTTNTSTGTSSEDTKDTHSEALKQALAVPHKVFKTDGGVGNSLSNTIWYIATRKKNISTNNRQS